MMKLILKARAEHKTQLWQRQWKNNNSRFRFYGSFLASICHERRFIYTRTHCGFHTVVLKIYFSVTISLLNLMISRSGLKSLFNGYMRKYILLISTAVTLPLTETHFCLSLWHDVNFSVSLMFHAA